MFNRADLLLARLGSALVLIETAIQGVKQEGSPHAVAEAIHEAEKKLMDARHTIAAAQVKATD